MTMKPFLSVVAILAAVAAVVAVRAADPPAAVNYQGVLRDASDKPRTGSFNIVFRFFDAASIEIFIDAHTLPAHQVVVTNGLFNVVLGGGDVADGSGPGVYTSLAQVFRDYGDVSMQVEVSGEILSPRIPVRAAAYALNASNLQGKPASSFLDLSATGQTKSGWLTSNQGFVGYNNSGVNQGYGVFGRGAQGGGRFESTSYSGIGEVGYGDYGIYAGGNGAGGFFYDADSSARTSVAVGEYGVDGMGAVAGGYFHDNGSNYVTLGHISGTGIFAHGTADGGRFTSAGLGVLQAAHGDYGVHATGTWPGGAGGYFADTYYSGAAFLGYHDLGIWGQGQQAGGFFRKVTTTAQAYLAASNGSYENGVYGLSSAFGESPGYFLDQYWGAWTYLGTFATKVYGNGSVSFVQNDPAEPSRVIRYTAPEGDEVAVYTRGTARLENGIAHVALGSTFRKVANPETGLTATATPAGEPIPLAIMSKSTRELVVRGPEGSNAAFDYAVWGLRIGFEDRPVVEPKKQEAYIPAKEGDANLYDTHPELRTFTSRARFATMEANAGLQPDAAARNAGAAQALEAAIHVYDRATDRLTLGAEPPVSAQSPAPRAWPVPTSTAPERAPATGAASLAEPSLERESPPSPQPVNTTPMAVSETVEAGDVLANDPEHPGELRRVSAAADRGVIGVVAGAPGTAWSATAPISLAGTVVFCKVDATSAPILVNDLLIASHAVGLAMRAGESPEQGTVIAKAIEPLDGGTGLIRVLIMPR